MTTIASGRLLNQQGARQISFSLRSDDVLKFPEVVCTSFPDDASKRPAIRSVATRQRIGKSSNRISCNLVLVGCVQHWIAMVCTHFPRIDACSSESERSWKWSIVYIMTLTPGCRLHCLSGARNTSNNQRVYKLALALNQTSTFRHTFSTWQIQLLEALRLRSHRHECEYESGFTGCLSLVQAQLNACLLTISSEIEWMLCEKSNNTLLHR